MAAAWPPQGLIWTAGRRKRTACPPSHDAPGSEWQIEACAPALEVRGTPRDAGRPGSLRMFSVRRFPVRLSRHAQRSVPHPESPSNEEHPMEALIEKRARLRVELQQAYGAWMKTAELDEGPRAPRDSVVIPGCPDAREIRRLEYLAAKERLTRAYAEQ